MKESVITKVCRETETNTVTSYETITEYIDVEDSWSMETFSYLLDGSPITAKEARAYFRKRDEDKNVRR